MIKLIILTCIASLLVVLGCGKPTTIDGSSEEAMERSIERAKADLSPEEKEQFEEAIMAIAFEGEDLFSLAELDSEQDAGGND